MRFSREEISNKVANISLVAACLVACIHYREYVLQGGTSGLAFWKWFPGPILKTAVPFFFVAAGYWLVGHADESHWWRRAICARVRSLMVPFLILNIIWFLLTTSDWSFDAWVRAVGLERHEYPALPQLWFVLRLFGLVIVAPLFYRVICWHKACGYVLFGIIYCCLVGRALYNEHVEAVSGLVKAFKYIIPPVGLSGMVLGMTFRRYGLPELKSWAGGVVLCVGFAFLLDSTLVAGVKGYGCLRAIFGFYLGMPIFILGAWSCMPGKRFLPWLTFSTFAIYLFHYPLLRMFYWILNWWGIIDLTSSPVVTILVVGASVVLSAGIAQVIKRSSFFQGLLLGGR